MPQRPTPFSFSFRLSFPLGSRLTVLGMALLLAACAGSPPSRHGSTPPRAPGKPMNDPSVGLEEISIQAMSLVGTPYRYGGNTPESGFDCSGLVAYVYREMLDLKLPRTSRDLAAVQGPKIDPQRLAPGDLVFFGDRGNVFHVGIYVGEGRFVHAPSTGGTVRLDSLGGTYWKQHYTGAKRVLH